MYGKTLTLKWVDLTNGIGNFPIVVYFKLMESLKTVKGFEDKNKRSSHIIQNMLFMVELNPVNVKVCKRIFNMIDANSTPNIVKANFLLDKWENMWEKEYKGLKTFDIVMGNPPYSNDVNTGDNKPYICFTSIGLEILKKDGFILFITPQQYIIIYYNVK